MGVGDLIGEEAEEEETEMNKGTHINFTNPDHPDTPDVENPEQAKAFYNGAEKLKTLAGEGNRDKIVGRLIVGAVKAIADNDASELKDVAETLAA